MTSRCGSLLLALSADVRSSDDVVAFEAFGGAVERPAVASFAQYSIVEGWKMSVKFLFLLKRKDSSVQVWGRTQRF